MIGNSKEYALSIDPAKTKREPRPLLVAQGLHILNRQVYEAVAGRDGETLRRLAMQHLPPGTGGLAVSLGTGSLAARLTPWVIASLLEWFDVPLFVSANILDHVPILRSAGHRIVVNAVTADPAILPFAMHTARQYGAGLAVLLVRPGLTPRGVDDRLNLAAEVLDLAHRTRLPLSRLYLDPVLACRPDPYARHISRGLPDIGPAAESINQLKEFDAGVRTIVGLGTGTQEVGWQNRWRTQLSMLSLLTAAGLDAVILNCRNRLLMTALMNNTQSSLARTVCRKTAVGGQKTENRAA